MSGNHPQVVPLKNPMDNREFCAERVVHKAENYTYMKAATQPIASFLLCLCALISIVTLKGAEIPSLLHATADQGIYSVDLATLDGESISLLLPTGESVVYKRWNQVGGREEKGTWTGIEEGHPASVAFLAQFNGVLSGTVNHGGHVYNLRPSGDNRYTLQHAEPVGGNDGCIVESSAASQLESPKPLARPETDAFPAARTAGINPADIGIPHLDVMFVYTTAARTAAGGENAIQALMRSCIASGNLTFQNSGINLRLRFVGSHYTTYNETPLTWEQILNKLGGKIDGTMDEIHGIRDTLKADAVFMLVSKGGQCGSGNLGYPNTNAGLMYAMADVGCAVGQYSFIHELGHNFGCSHAAINGSGYGIPVSAYGFVTADQKYRTVLATFDNAGYSERIPMFSSPINTFMGYTMGTASRENNRGQIEAMLARPMGDFNGSPLGFYDGIPEGFDQIAEIQINQTLPITLAGMDPELQTITYSDVSSPAHGSLTGSAPNLVYTPTNDFIGTDSFTFRLNDGTQNSPEATVSITVLAPPTPLFTLADDGLISEGSEDGEIITITLTGRIFAPTLNVANWSISNQPAGVSKGALTRINDTTATLSLSGNRTTDYLTDITNLSVSATPDQVTDWDTTNVSANSGVTFTAFNAPPVVSAGFDQTLTMSASTFGNPAASNDIYLNASNDDGANSIWEDAKGNWNLVLDNTVTFVPNAGSSLPGISSAYDFPGGLSGAGGGTDSPLTNMAVSNNPISLEIWFKPDSLVTIPSNGQVLWETGGGTGLGIFYNDGRVEAAHDGNQGRISTDVSGLIGEFIQVIVTYDTTSTTNNFKIYINGVLKTTSSRNDSNISGGDGAGLGRRGQNNVGGAGNGDGNTLSFDGKIAVFRAYRNKILNATEVQGNYRFIAGPKTVIVNLIGTANDPESQTLMTTWSVVSGPSGASIDDSASLNTAAMFNQFGNYVMRLTASDGDSSVSDDLTVSINPLPSGVYSVWAGKNYAHPFTQATQAADPDRDGMSNLMEFAMGTDPTKITGGAMKADGTAHGSAIIVPSGAGDTYDFIFIRRHDHGTSGGVNYTPQFSADLETFYDSLATPTVIADSALDPDYEVVKVPYPDNLWGGKEATFGRLQLNETP